MAAKRVKLPFWRTVGESYRWGFGRVPEVIARYWPVLLAQAAVSLLLDWVAAHATPEDGLVNLATPNFSDIFGEPNLVVGIISWGSIFISAIFAAVIAVPWHGLVLRGQPLSGSGLTIDWRIIGYATWGFGITLPFLTCIPLLAFGIAQLTSEPGTEVVHKNDAWAIFYAGWLALFVGIVTFTRLGIKVVAAGLRDPNGSLPAVWRGTKWSYWRIFWGSTLTLLPEILFSFFAIYHGAVDAVEEMWPSTAIWKATVTIITAILGLVPLTFLSLAYRHFVMTPPERTVT
jgi:hypothetical protein